MHSVADQPPAGLLDALRRRHRRHRARVAGGCAAAVLVVAVGVQPVAHALQRPLDNGGQASARPAGPRPSYSIRVQLGPAVMPYRTTPDITWPTDNTVLSSCARANTGSVGTNWRSGATRLAGSVLWFIGGGSGHAGGLTLDPGVMVVSAAKPGATVTLEVARAGQGLLRFLYGPDDSVNAGARYTMRSGEERVTFVSCPAGSGDLPEPKNVTTYYGALLLRGNRCVPVDVWLPGDRSPVSARLGDCG